jgi:thiamine-phosphate pyrophosphorylase
MAASGPFLQMCDEVIAVARPERALVIVNDRADLAVLSGADGVHVGQDDLTPADARRILGGSALVGLSTHSLEQATVAAAAPVDYIAVGPIFGTRTKDASGEAVGTRLISEVRSMLDARGVHTPIVAIGGITLSRVPEVIEAGAASVAVISDLLSTGNPRGRVREFVDALGSV